MVQSALGNIVPLPSYRELKQYIIYFKLALHFH